MNTFSALTPDEDSAYDNAVSVSCSFLACFETDSESPSVFHQETPGTATPTWSEAEYFSQQDLATILQNLAGEEECPETAWKDTDLQQTVTQGSVTPTRIEAEYLDEQDLAMNLQKLAVQDYTSKTDADTIDEDNQNSYGESSKEPILQGRGLHGFSIGQKVFWAQRDKALGQKGSVIGPSDYHSMNCLLIRFKTGVFHCRTAHLSTENPKRNKAPPADHADDMCKETEGDEGTEAEGDPRQNHNYDTQRHLQQANSEANHFNSGQHGRGRQYARQQRLNRLKRLHRKRKARLAQKLADIASWNACYDDISDVITFLIAALKFHDTCTQTPFFKLFETTKKTRAPAVGLYTQKTSVVHGGFVSEHVAADPTALLCLCGEEKFHGRVLSGWLIGGMQSDEDVSQPSRSKHKRLKVVPDSDSETPHIFETACAGSELGEVQANSSQECATARDEEMQGDTTTCRTSIHATAEDSFPSRQGQSSRTGTIALELNSPLRTPIYNPSNTTCYLGGLLQALHQAASFEALVQKHAMTISCGEGCAWCLLREASSGTQDQQIGYDPQNWSKFFDRVDLSLSLELKWHFGSQQHDPMEALPIILQDTGSRTLKQQQEHLEEIQSILGVQVRSVIWANYHCQCPATKVRSQDKEELHTYMEVTAPRQGERCTLSELLEREHNAEPVTSDANPPCHLCYQEPTSTRTLHIVRAHQILLISINRFTVEQTQRAGEAPVFRYSKRCSHVTPNPELTVGGACFKLKSVLVHRGERSTSGHYVCYAMQKDNYVFLYDDSVPVLDNILQGLPEEASTQNRLCVYEHMSQNWDAKRLVPVTSLIFRSDKRKHEGGFDDGPTPSRGRSKSLESSEQEEPGTRDFMDSKTGADQVDRDARALLQVFLDKGDAQAFLAQLPAFVCQSGVDIPLNECNRCLEYSIESLLREHINSNAALETLQYIGDSAYYPLLVMAQAFGTARIL